MDALGLFVQGVDGNNVFLINQQISQTQALQLSRKFFSFIAQLRSEDLGPSGPKPGQPNMKSGSAVLNQQYRILYALVYEVYVVLFMHAYESPYALVPTLTRAKKALVAACKGTEVSVSQLTKRYTDAYFGLERVLHGEDAAEGSSQKVLEYSPFTPGPPVIGFNAYGKIYDGGITTKGPLPVLSIDENELRGFDALNNSEISLPLGEGYVPANPSQRQWNAPGDMPRRLSMSTRVHKGPPSTQPDRPTFIAEQRPSPFPSSSSSSSSSQPERPTFIAERPSSSSSERTTFFAEQRPGPAPTPSPPTSTPIEQNT